MQFKLPLGLSIFLLSTTLTSCMVGPDYHSPRPPRTCRYTELPQPTKTVSIKQAGNAGKSQHFIMCKTISSQWWHVFHSPEINGLICAGLANSPNLAAAKASLIQAQQNFLAQLGTLLPSVTGNFSAQRQRFNAVSLGGSGAGPASTIFNLVNANVGVAYTLDVFGGLRRQVEAAGAQVDVEQFELEAAFLTLSSNIVTTAITIASLRAQIAATNELIRAQQETVTLVKNQFELGSVSQIDVSTQETQLEQLRAVLPPLKQNLAQNLHALSVLIGNLPSEDRLPKIDLDKLNLPTHLPISMPSSFVRQRPDIQAADALLHAASAQIGVATANMYPQITLTGSFGWENKSFNTLFSPTSQVWNVLGAIAQPIFNGGSLVAKKKAAIGAFQQTAAQYRQTVLQAFQNVADTLRALQHDAQLLKAQKAAETAARRAYTLTREQYNLGSINYLNLLIAQRTYQQTRIDRIKAQAARYTDTAALFQALGGGWWHRCSLDCDPLLQRNVQQYRPEVF